MFRRISSWLYASKPQPTRNRYPRQRNRLWIEQLEDRTVPSGTVTGVLTRGTLTLTAADDLLSGVPGLNNQNITLDGGAGNTITVIGMDGETGSGIGTFSNVSKIKLVMGLGDDLVTVKNTNLPDTLTFLGGDGANTLALDGAAGPNTLASVVVTNGEGFDTFRIANGTNTITGKVTVDNGIGGSHTLWGVAAGDALTIGGTVQVTNSTGADTFQIEGASATFNSGVTIKNGAGNSSTLIDQAGAGTATMFKSSLAFTNLEGFDSYALGGASLALLGMTISNGGGGSDIQFNAADTTITGNLSITNGSGNDNFSLGGANFAVTGGVTFANGTGDTNTQINATTLSQIGGALSITNGDGNNLFSTGGLETRLSSVSINNGVGGSTTSFGGTTCLISGSVSINNGSGSNTTTFAAATSLISANTTITNGPGDDNVKILGGDFTSTGNITIANGDGTSLTQLAATNLIAIAGTLQVTNKDGVDTFAVAVPTAQLHTVTVNNGSGDTTTKFDAPSTQFSGNLAVANAAGADLFVVTDTVADLTFTGALTLSNGNGGGTTNFNGIKTRIVGSVSVTNAAGFDTLDVGATALELNVSGAFTIKNGDGGSLTSLDPGAADATTILGGTLTIVNGDGLDTFTNGGAAADLHDISISNGNGGGFTVFSARDTTITGNISVTNAAGNDSFYIASAGTFTISGAVTVNNGNGGSRTGIQNQTARPTINVGGTFSVTNGAGFDSYIFMAKELNLHDVVISNGDDGSNIDFAFALKTVITGNFSITNLAGKDEIHLTNGTFAISVTNDLIISNGNGGSITDLTPSAGIAGVPEGITVGGTLRVTNFDGADNFEVRGGTSTFHDIVINNGDGGSSMFIGTLTTNITGNVTVTNGNGFDIVSAGSFGIAGFETHFTVMGNVAVDHGGGGSNTNFRPDVGVINGGLSVSASDGIDNVNIFRMTMNGAVQLNLGVDDDTVNIDDSILAAAVTINTGSGNDTILLERASDTAVQTVFQGSVSIDTGSGDDAIRIGLDADDCVTFSGPVPTFTGGNGLDTLEMGTVANVFAAGLPVLSGWEWIL